ncbi:MAG: hypothetical protein QOD13_3729 [Thermoleophilaceae bacterium]|nr:hypothetical protein [Thermoleophilaceae bacterium]
MRGVRLADALEQLLAGGLVGGQEALLLVGEVVVEGLLRNTGAAGPQALERRERLRDRYAELMLERRGTQVGPRLPVEIFHAVVAAVDDVVVRHIREHGAEELPALEPVLLYLQVALLAGPQVAAESAEL